MEQKNPKFSATLFNRYLWLTNTIFSNQYISKEEIDHKWRESGINETHETSIPLRTFHRHKDAILEIFNLEISYDRTMGGYYIKNDEKLATNNLMQRIISTFSIKNIIFNNEELQERIILEENPSGEMYLSPIAEAMKENERIDITYKKFNDAEPSTFAIEPYCLKVFKQRWYVLAKSEKHEEPRIYALDRIHGVNRRAGEHFELPQGFDAKEFFKDIYGVSLSTEKKEQIRIKIDARQANYLRTLKLHDSQEEVERTSNYSIFSYELIPTFEFAQELRAQGPDIEILEPLSLRQEFHKEARKLMSHNR